ncbi:MAG: hypothetical protein AB1815_02650 [Bacillota bacterium]
MTKITAQDYQRVKKWLYSIRASELAIFNLQAAIVDLEAKLQSPPSYIMTGLGNYNLASRGGGESSSKGENYASWYEETQARHEFLIDQLVKKQRKVTQFYDTLAEMRNEKWGRQAAELVEKKYYNRIKPDKAIYTMFLFISDRQFYRLNQLALKFFYEVLPDVFLVQNKK